MPIKRKKRPTTPRVSVFTPSHDSRWLDECYASLEAQAFDDWEWIVLLNGGANWNHRDPRVRIHRSGATGVGALKAECCELAKGEFLVELDHDDLLDAAALALVVEAFDSNPDAGFVYSDCAQINEDGTRNEDQFDLRNGWEYYETTVCGRSVSAVISMAPLPHNVSYIWYAPNHLRAFRQSVYEKVGGYDPARDILDDQDLMCRLYQETEFIHIAAPLYLQRVHGANTQSDPATNARIQIETVALYDQHIQPNALAWARRNNLACLDLGSAHNKPEGYEGIDLYDTEGVDYVGDVFSVLSSFADSSVGVIRAVDFLEHVADKVGLFNELHRVLAHGGMLLSLTPSTDGRGAFQDPTHIAFYNQNSFWYWTQDQYRAFVPEITARFLSSRLVTYFPSDWHRENDISYVCANLVCVKAGPRAGGLT